MNGLIHDYFDGSITGEQFIEIARRDESIAMWFQDILPIGADIIDKPYIPYRQIDVEHFEYQDAASTHPFWKGILTAHCLNCLEDRVVFTSFFRLTRDFDTASGRLNVYGFLHSLGERTMTQIPRTDRYEKEFEFYLDVCGDRFEGPEIEKYLDQTVMKIYRGAGSRRDRIKLAKETVKQLFHVDGKYPRWIQGGEWPMGEKSPMQYVSMKHKGESCSYIFRDVDTDAIREVTQWY